jgi:hypothetical protein
MNKTSLTSPEFSTTLPAASAPPSIPYDGKVYARAYGSVWPDDFTGMMNPLLDRTLRATLYVGPPRNGKPLSSQDDVDFDAPPTAEARRDALARQAALFMRFEFPPGVEVLVPDVLVSSFVLVRDGVICGGHCPHLAIPNDPCPPTLHRSLIAEAEPAPLAMPRRMP